MMKDCEFKVVIFNKPQDYQSIYQLQLEQKENLHLGSNTEYLYLLEHLPVFTAGRQFKQEHLLIPLNLCRERGIDFYHIDRGGDITYHGPGQLVGYPIIDLNRHKITVHQYLRKLEDIIIETLHTFHIQATTLKPLTGVWVQDRKICAIGIGVKNGITWHGFSINLTVDLTPYQWIVPCGISDKPVTSLQKEIGTSSCPTKDEFLKVLLPIFFRQFGIEHFSIINS
ncbi:MAG TPA: lipoyl(octanoyl) transferase LipB [Candidatus Hydrogenedens sp.]|nr:lipoyl(octanoyl) transferase LipB [Candidatus Hydrogenedens sp.]HOK09776.1 lipoyl(octanoyl) transferase LipB [Candidatus Hydrogenedens sp.]HPP59096.1 lipoyl(octanoyl) transferase LipB [Candidatus Hydrogenedens sp.]